MLDKNSVLTLLGEYFWDEIEIFAAECVGEFTVDELGQIFTDYLVDYARLDIVDELKVASVEVEEDDGTEIVSGEMQLTALVQGYAYWDGEEQYLGAEETEMCYEFSFEMRDGKVVSGIELEMV